MIDRDAAARLGITVSQIDNTLYDAFGQRQVSTIYVARNQYHVIMEVAPRYWQNPETLKDVYVSTSGGSVGGSQATNAVAGTVVAPGVFDQLRQRASRAQRRHQLDRRHRQGRGLDRLRGLHQPGDHDSAVGGRAVSRKARRRSRSIIRACWSPTPFRSTCRPACRSATPSPTIDATMNRIGVPATIRGTFQGTAKAFQDLLNNQPFLILAALVTIYIVLGVLYESYVHPLTILSTLPSAGVGALLALMAFHTEFSIMALIGVILLIGIVKKNAIMMIDFALEAERRRGLSSLRRDLRGLPAALPADHDDDHGGVARRAAARDRHGRRRRAAPAARHRDRRRPDPEPGADALHDAGDLSVHGPVPSLEPTAAGAAAPRRAVPGCNRANRCQQQPLSTGLALERALCDAGIEAWSLLRTQGRRTPLKSKLEPVPHE